MRTLVLIGAFSLITLGIASCVGDDPSVASGSDASTDDSSAGNDGGNGSDSATTTDGSTTSDSGVDAGFVDSCIGHTDCPDKIANGSLILWLRGNIGETCGTDHRLTLWKDQSTFHHDATPGVTPEDAGVTPPQCGVGSIGTTPTVTFTAPAEVDAGKATEFVDETLAVDLSLLSNTDYTVIVVHARTADTSSGMLATDDSFIPLGSHGPITCHNASTDPEDDFLFGFYSISPTSNGVFYDEGCATGGDPNDNFLAGVAEVDELIFSGTTGHQVLINGAAVYTGDGTGNDSSGVVPIGAGLIGRGNNAFGGDSRYRGNIGEIIIYDVALAPADLAAIHAHLTRQWGITF